MKKEKIVLKNGEELSYDSIGHHDGRLIISFTGGDAAELEQTFRNAGQNNLEMIRQTDAAGNGQAIHERYDVFEAVNKRINAGKTEAGETADIVDIVLAQEDELEMKIRHLEDRVGAQEEVTDAMLMDQLG